MMTNNKDILYPLFNQLNQLNIIDIGFDAMYEIIDDYIEEEENIESSQYYELLLLIRYNDPISVDINEINNLIQKNI